MSRIGKQPIVIPETTEVTVADGTVRVKGPLGELTRLIRSEVDVVVKDKQVIIKSVRNSRLAKALFGTYAAHINNMVRGVNELYVKKLVVEGVGYRSQVSGKELTLNVGFSHPVKLNIPDANNLLVVFFSVLASYYSSIPPRARVWSVIYTLSVPCFFPL